MTTKEKAEEFVYKFNYNSKHYLMLDAKKCALIAIKEMIKLLDELPMSQDVIEQFAYLQEVKQEIKKL